MQRPRRRSRRAPASLPLSYWDTSSREFRRRNTTTRRYPESCRVALTRPRGRASKAGNAQPDPLHIPRNSIGIGASSRSARVHCTTQGELLRRQTEPLHEHEGRAVMYANMLSYAVPPASALAVTGVCHHGNTGLLDDGTRISGSMTYTAYAATQPRIANNQQRAPARNSGDNAADAGAGSARHPSRASHR